MDIKDVALGEAEVWSRAQELLNTQRLEIGDQEVDTEDSHSIDNSELACYCDGSWKEGDLTSGVGGVLQTHQGRMEILGMKGLSRRISPLHTEIYGLLNAMEDLK
ncbi:unnamed protein product [Cochlearia groenlandica]